MMVEIESAPYQDTAILTSALRKVHPYKENSEASELDRHKYPHREVEEFPGRDVYVPYHHYKYVKVVIILVFVKI